MQQAKHLDQQGFPLDATGRGRVHQRHDALTVSGNHGFNERQRLVVIQRAEHGADRVRRQFTVTAGNRLIGQA